MAKVLAALLVFIIKNFATPIAFIWMFRVDGAKPAIALAMGVTLVVLAGYALARQKPSPFFVVASFFTVLMGGVDLLVDSPRFFKLEPAVQNFLIGTVFLGSAILRAPIAAWFATALPVSVRPEVGEDSKEYLRKLTFVWAAYLYLKAVLFLYLAYQVDLGQLVLLRSVIGGLTLAVLLGGEIAYRKYIK